MRGWRCSPLQVLRAIVARLNAELNKVLLMPDVRRAWADQGAQTAGGSPERLAAHIRAELAKWGKVLREVKIRSQ